MKQKQKTLNQLRELQKGKINLNDYTLNSIQDEIEDYIWQKTKKRREKEEEKNEM